MAITTNYSTDHIYFVINEVVLHMSFMSLTLMRSPHCTILALILPHFQSRSVNGQRRDVRESLTYITAANTCEIFGILNIWM